MKILATFDGSKFSESIITQLELMARIPNAEFILFRVSDPPHGRLQQHMTSSRPDAMGETLGTTPIVVSHGDPQWAENKEQAVERRMADLHAYLSDIAKRLPADAVTKIETVVADEPAAAIIECARHSAADVIVMATHSRAALLHVIFGSTTEQVVRSGVAPVLVVHPKAD
jgi:nucleotide-binding universal stress UspA family protein